MLPRQYIYIYTHTQTDRQTDRQTDKQTHTYIYIHIIYIVYWNLMCCVYSRSPSDTRRILGQPRRPHDGSSLDPRSSSHASPATRSVGIRTCSCAMSLTVGMVLYTISKGSDKVPVALVAARCPCNLTRHSCVYATCCRRVATRATLSSSGPAVTETRKLIREAGAGSKARFPRVPSDKR